VLVLVMVVVSVRELDVVLVSVVTEVDVVDE